jgi:glycosyltransferase involved in cell wall biosynthesis
MLDFRVTVVITTYNRSHLLGRAIRSTLDQHWPNLEVLVVDDASTDDTPDLMRNSFPEVRYLCQDSNRGVSAARNRGLREASQPWVVFLDDDDTLLPSAVARIASRIAEFPDAERYPVLQFSHGNGRIPTEFMIVRLEHYATEVLQGDFLPVIRKERFLAEGLAYPEFVRAGEGLLWFRVAEEHGIPTWADRLGRVHKDALVRQTSADYQLLHARDFAELQERTLSEFGEVLAARFPAHYQKKLLGAATYWILAEERTVARSHIRLALQRRYSIEAMGLWALSFLPRSWAQRCFILYRRRVDGWKSEG